MKRSVIAVAGILFAITFAHSAEEVSNFPSSGINGINAKISMGEIIFQAIDTNEIKVEQQFSIPGKANTNRENCSVTLKTQGNILRYIASDSPFRRKDQHCEVNLKITAPKNMLVKAVSGIGPINLAGFNATADIKANMGDIKLNDMSGGDLDITARMGNIEGKNIYAKHVKAICDMGNINFDGLIGTAKIINHNGNIAMQWKSAPKAETVDISASMGNIALTFPEDVRFISKIKASLKTVKNDFGSTMENGFKLNIKASMGKVEIIKAGK